MSETRSKGSFGGFLGIDISRGTFDGCCIDREGKVLFHVSLPMNRTNFEKLVTHVCAISLPKGSLLIGMESTAQNRQEGCRQDMQATKGNCVEMY